MWEPRTLLVFPKGEYLSWRRMIYNFWAQRLRLVKASTPPPHLLFRSFMIVEVLPTVSLNPASFVTNIKTLMKEPSF